MILTTHKPGIGGETMKDARIDELARNIIEYSVELKEGERVLIEGYDIPPDLVTALIREASNAGGVPLVTLKSNQVLRELFKNGSEDQMKLIGEIEKQRMENVQAYVGIRGSHNISELSDVPPEKMKMFQEHWMFPVHLKVRVPNTKWVVMRYPSSSMAQQAQMSSEEFEDFYFNVCTLDYSKMSKAMDPLVELMKNTDKVHIKGPGTDLTFSIKGLNPIKCDGKLNIPDGEVFTAPVKDSVNGTIQYNATTIYQGTVFDNIKLTFKEGKIVEATGSDTKRLNEILDTDEGARYVGEFALGVNPYITRAMKDILFDEKIMGSLHFTPGNSYDDCDNGNKSSVHWDMVLIQSEEWGGGEIWFDDVLIRKDGMFVIDELKPLNPENLK